MVVHITVPPLLLTLEESSSIKFTVMEDTPMKNTIRGWLLPYFQKLGGSPPPPERMNKCNNYKILHDQFILDRNHCQNFDVKSLFDGTGLVGHNHIIEMDLDIQAEGKHLSWFPPLTFY
jgi:hypothetical protein